jgi:micrococcal nuclease
MIRAIIAACFLTVLCISDSFAASAIEGVVRAVYDGDTILLATRRDSRLKVRLYGIDAPETAKPNMPGQPFGLIAKRTLMYKVMGRQVSADIIDIDQYHRSVAVIRYAGRDINREMVMEGLAWAYRQYLKGGYVSEYIGAEDRARSMRAGLWRDHNPIPPWEFRHALKGGTRQRRQWLR